MGSGVILMLLVLLRSSLVTGTERKLKAPAARFLAQFKGECHFANGTARLQVRLLFRHIYDRQDIAHFDSRRRTWEAVTEFGRPDAERWNRRPDLLAALRAHVERLCRHNYRVYEPFFSTREVQPTVRISPTKADPLAHHTLLICTAMGYYPSEVEIKWLKNGQEQTEGVGYADELQNGDWTFQSQVMLQTVPQRGDVYTCLVEHISLMEPISVQWKPQTSDSAKSKVWTGAMGAVLGVVFLAVGLSLYLKNRKGTSNAADAQKIQDGQKRCFFTQQVTKEWKLLLENVVMAASRATPQPPPTALISGSFLPQDPACEKAFPEANGSCPFV